MHVENRNDQLHLITTSTGDDHTARMQTFIEGKIPDLAAADLAGFVFKKSSPSSGLHDAKYYTSAGMPYGRGPGLFAKAFIEAFPEIPAEDEGRLHDAKIRENFIERVFVMHRWQTMRRTQSSELGDLVAFHTVHKLILMSHNHQAMRSLGKMVAEGKRQDFDGLCDEYLALLMRALRLQATVRKHVNVLQHIMGYFKKQLVHDEKEELLEVIGDYHQGLIPLIVPIALLRHYVRKYDNAYLRDQLYLHPFPAELMLRNHV